MVWGLILKVQEQVVLCFWQRTCSSSQSVLKEACFHLCLGSDRTDDCLCVVATTAYSFHVLLH